MTENYFHLITHRLCPYVQRSIILLKEKSIAYQRTDIDLRNPPEWFLAVSPLQKVPLLVINDTDILFESAVICEYLDEITPRSLHANNVLEKAQHRAWIEFGSQLLDKISKLYSTKDKISFDSHLQEIQTMFQRIEDILGHGTFFSGNDFLLIDAVYGPIFRYFDVIEKHVTLSIFDKMEKIQQWRINLKHRESIKTAVSSDYADELIDFIRERKSYLSNLL